MRESSLDKKISEAVGIASKKIMRHFEEYPEISIVLIRYSCEKDLWFYRKDMCGTPLVVHERILYSVKDFLSQKEIPFKEIMLDKKSYHEFIETAKLEDCESSRSAWGTHEIARRERFLKN